MGLSSGGGAGGGFVGDRLLVGLAVAEHGEQDVDTAAGQADQGSVVPLALSSLPVVVGAAGRIGQTGEC
jgi:hypothetical protein